MFRLKKSQRGNCHTKMNKEKLIKEMNTLIEKHLDLAPDIYTSPVCDCQHKHWGYRRGMMIETSIYCLDCALEINDSNAIDFVEKIMNNDKNTTRDTLKRIEFLLEVISIMFILLMSNHIEKQN